MTIKEQARREAEAYHIKAAHDRDPSIELTDRWEELVVMYESDAIEIYAKAAEHYLTQLAERDKVIEGLRAEIVALQDEPEDPYWYWPQCDVDGCLGVSGCNGMYWRPGYWCLCSKHSDLARGGAERPPMKQSSIDREASRLADGTFPSSPLKP